MCGKVFSLHQIYSRCSKIILATWPSIDHVILLPMLLLAVKISHFILNFQNSIFVWNTVTVILEGFQSSSLEKQKSVKSKKKRFFYLSNSTTCTTVVFSISRFICLNVILLVQNFHHFEASDWLNVPNKNSTCQRVSFKFQL